MKKGKLIAAAALVLALGVVTGATIAYLTDTTGPVVNTFTVGDVGLSLDEAKVDKYGVPVPDAPRVQGNEYLLIPGQTYTKDPTTTVTADSVSSYVRMKVKVTDLAALEALLPYGSYPEYYAEPEEGVKVFLLEKLVNGWKKSEWNSEWDWSFDGVDTYEFRYVGPKSVNGVVPASATATKLEPLFTEFTLPWFFTAKQIKTLKNFKIDVTAEAIQAATFETADTAWDAFDHQMKPVSPGTP